MRPLLPAATLLLLTACTPTDPMTGGSCTYETAQFTATAQTVEAEGIMFTTEVGEIWVPAEYLPPTPPKAGDTVTLERELITSGTCTPEIFTVLPIEADASDAP